MTQYPANQHNPIHLVTMQIYMSATRPQKTNALLIWALEYTDCPGFDTKQTDGEAPGMLEL